jgi:hypothetical protein
MLPAFTKMTIILQSPKTCKVSETAISGMHGLYFMCLLLQRVGIFVVFLNYLDKETYCMDIVV